MCRARHKPRKRARAGQGSAGALEVACDARVVLPPGRLAVLSLPPVLAAPGALAGAVRSRARSPTPAPAWGRALTRVAALRRAWQVRGAAAAVAALRTDKQAGRQWRRLGRHSKQVLAARSRSRRGARCSLQALLCSRCDGGAAAVPLWRGMKGVRREHHRASMQTGCNNERVTAGHGANTSVLLRQSYMYMASCLQGSSTGEQPLRVNVHRQSNGPSPVCAHAC